MKIIDKEFNEAWTFANYSWTKINTFSKKEIAKMFFERGRKNGILWTKRKNKSGTN